MRRPDAVLIDRDGTIGGTGHFIHPRAFQPYPFSTEALTLLKRSGVKILTLTNQNRISNGEVTLQEFEEEFIALGFDDAFICPHSPHDECDCRKPKPGLLLRAAEKHNLDLSNCVVIGDVGATDMLAAHAVGAKKVIVRTGWGESSLGEYRRTWADVEPDRIATDLMDAVRWILEKGDGAQ